jgi:hypothetical protein
MGLRVKATALAIALGTLPVLGIGQQPITLLAKRLLNKLNKINKSVPLS